MEPLYSFASGIPEILDRSISASFEKLVITILAGEKRHRFFTVLVGFASKKNAKCSSNKRKDKTFNPPVGGKPFREEIISFLAHTEFVTSRWIAIRMISS